MKLRELLLTGAMPSPTIMHVEEPAPEGGGGGGAPAGGDPWFKGADDATVGFIQSKGWHDKPPAEAALAAIKSYHEAQTFIGAPPERIIKLPTDANDEAGWKDVWTRLGAPADAKDYDLSAVKVGDQPLDQGFQDFIRAQATALHLPKDAAAQLAAAFVKYTGDSETSQAAERTAKIAEERKLLDANWGANKEGNTFVAKKGAEALGFDASVVDALENVVGYAKIMEGLRKVGELSGEAKFINGGQGPNGNGGIMTREQAVARKAELMNDTAWAKRYTDGGAAENRELQALLAIITAD
jgi:hypothetical protein